MSTEEIPMVDPADLALGHETISDYLPVRVVDMDAQLVDLIYWELVEAGFRTDIIPFNDNSINLDVDYLKQNTDALIFSGSGKSVHDENAPHIPVELLDGSVPVMGYCYGAQDIAHVLGGEVSHIEIEGHHLGEYNKMLIKVDPAATMFKGLTEAVVRMNHGQSIVRLPDGFHETGWSDNALAAFESDDKPIAATQFHPEVADTEGGTEMIVRFLKSVGIEPDPNYTLEVALNEYMDEEEAKIAEILEADGFIAGFLSGGVDSMVAASAVLAVAGRLNRLDQIQFFYVDNGHTRFEDDTIVDQMIAHGMPVEKIDAAHEFFHTQTMVTPKDGEPFLAGPLVEESDPETKRLLIGTIFNQISTRLRAEIAERTGRTVYLMQGTNASDIIESGKIKGHHNVQAMEADRQAGELVEPLWKLLKYHVRMLAETRYGLPKEFASRQPFPGVGLGPRIVVNLRGELPLADPVLQVRLDKIVQEAAGRRLGAHIVRINTVGQKGDTRSLANVAFLHGEPAWDILPGLSEQITDSFASLNRVFYMPDAAVYRKLIHGVVTRDDEQFVMHELKHMEGLHRRAMIDYDLDPYLTQHFVGTLGVDLVGADLPTLAVRMFISGNDLDKRVVRRRGMNKETFRTGVAGQPGLNISLAGFQRYIATMRAHLPYHGALAYDITGKPPGTVEWE